MGVQVFVRRGVVHLRGVVADLEDVDNAEDVAARVPGVREIVEVPALSREHRHL